MPSLPRVLLILWSLISLVGCTAMQPLGDVRPTTVRQEVRVGDEIEVTNREGAVYRLTVTRLDQAALYGKDGTLLVRMPLADIGRLSVRRTSVGRTVGATSVGVGVTVLVVYTVLGIVALVAFYKFVRDA